MSDCVRGQAESSRVPPSQARSSEVVRGQAESSEVARGCRTASEVKRSQARSADCVRGRPRSSEVKAHNTSRNKGERAPPLDAPKLTIFSVLPTLPLFFLLFDTALSPFRLRSAPFRSVPLRSAPFRLRSVTRWRRAFSVPFRERGGTTLARALVAPPLSLHSTTPAGARGVTRRTPFRYGMAARVLRSVPRAGRHYTRARARYAAPFAPLHSARRACACGGTTLARALVAPPPAPALPRLAFRSASAAALHSLCSLRRRPRSTPRQAGSAATAAARPAQIAPLCSANCAGRASASLRSTPSSAPPRAPLPRLAFRSARSAA